MLLIIVFTVVVIICCITRKKNKDGQTKEKEVEMDIIISNDDKNSST